jgi:hypothetical protein
MYTIDIAPHHAKYEDLHETNRASTRAQRKHSKYTYKTPTQYIAPNGKKLRVVTKAAKITTYKGTPQSRAAKIQFSKELARRHIKGHDEPGNRDNFEHFCGNATYSMGYASNEYAEYVQEPILDITV